MAGADKDELVAQQLGAGSASEMSEVHSQYKDAIKRKLEEASRPCGGYGGGACSGGAGQRGD